MNVLSMKYETSCIQHICIFIESGFLNGNEPHPPTTHTSGPHIQKGREPLSTLLDLGVLGTLLWSSCQRKLYKPMVQVVIGFRNELGTMKDCETQQALSHLLDTA